VHSLTDGRGADLVLELSGSPAAARLSLEVLRTGGSALWVGAVFPTDPISVSPEMIVRRCLTVSGLHNYGPLDLAKAMTFLTENHTKYPFLELVPDIFPLDEVNEGFSIAETKHPIRVGVACNSLP
jgi:threonine dehydrogenase-like Zn-dependent dehydrogenase